MNEINKSIGVSLKNVVVNYPLFDSGTQNLRKRIIKIISFGHFQKDLGNVRIVKALKNISFDLKPGNSVGIIGRNGAGKSTLLKLMAGVLEPTSGEVSRSGIITSILTAGSGMEFELDGYQNIRRVGLLRGFSLKEVEEMMPEVVEFSQLGDFLSLPVRTYSSGMRMRLAFAIATVGAPDVLLIDEVFGAGDASFQERARDRISRLLKRSKCVVFSSHSDSLVREFCTNCLYLDEGRIKAYGETDEIIKYYENDVKKKKDNYKTI